MLVVINSVAADQGRGNGQMALEERLVKTRVLRYMGNLQRIINLFRLLLSGNIRDV